MKFFYILIVTYILTSCAKICVVPATSVNTNGNTTTIAESKFPCKYVDSFKLGSEYAIKAIYSPNFETYLKDHIENNIGEGEHVLAWKDLNAADIVKKMKEEINGTFADTYGGIKGWWLNKFYGNLAYDGTENGPILLNRIPLKKRTPQSIANTIGHEVAHRIGLIHPHSDDDLSIANREPPYVIGDLIEKVAYEISAVK